MNFSTHATSGPNPPPNTHSHSHPVAIPRPQVSIERLPARRQVNEPRESMNCKSCRKRKIKCNRLRPACEACQLFQCPCVYDAVPKKRGPKTDVLEALLKRVDGLEAKLKEKNARDHEKPQDTSCNDDPSDLVPTERTDGPEPPSKRQATGTSGSPARPVLRSFPSDSAASSEPPASPISTSVLVHTYFARFHGKPYYILDQESVRQRMQANKLPDHLCYAICAVAARHVPLLRGESAAIRLSEEYAAWARRSVDIDEPCIDGLQTLLLLVLAFVAAGNGKKAYMLMTSAIGMAMALELNREVIDSQASITPAGRELRRRIFWTCYLLDRFLACGSKRPSLIRDKSIALRLPSWSPNVSLLTVDGEFFHRGSNMQYLQGAGKQSQGSTGMLIDIARVLGITNRYLAAGGVKGDSHFPWHSLSTLSKIRQELDFWAAGAGEIFSTNTQALLARPESTILMLGKLVYHLIHCLVYRPFLPIDLAELSGNGQHQSWQIDATNMCFLHANAIAELIDAARQANTIEWPSLVGYCICTAATVHIHGVHYTDCSPAGDVGVFSPSNDYLSREMQQLSELQHAWANVHHQRETLQDIFNAHGELVKALVESPTRYAPAFHLEDFFDRYTNIGGPGGKTFHFDPAHLSLWSKPSEPAGGGSLGAETESLGSGESERLHLKRKIDESVGGGQSLASSYANEAGDPRALQPVSSESSIHQENGHQSLVSPRADLSADKVDTQRYDEMTHNTVDLSLPPKAEQASARSPVCATTLVDKSAPHPSNSAEAGFRNYGYGSTAVPEGASHMSGNANGNRYDAVFGSMASAAFGNPADWHGDDEGQHSRMSLLNSDAAMPGLGVKSSNGEIAFADGKDPFLCLLEQLAEEEHRLGTVPGSELDLFFPGVAGPA
ncbi:hypothetical protein HIM_08123 [Hirsutella minnesotensis 3608]|uniref:Zn(2)-C6 fungal-type domain-containing protein n=1 Tax=Hirsutella minnesotensis 3608 TaxID=1043627 RepID=A0A0F8A3U8_9HYPO|nr:hypothetical protein HIM_08123 [Hirsutella minnesotensis 3608]